MNYADSQEIWSLLGRILLSALLGGLLGFERDVHGRGAGLRTHLLVSMGACVFMVLSTHVESFGVAIGAPGFSRVTDPARIAAQVVTGIGFLGAGVIIKEGLSIRGLTTAACLWVAAAIGMASGVGFFSIAVATTVVALLSLTFLRYFEDFYRDLANKRFALILSEPLNVKLQDRVNAFSEENNAWVKWVSQPLLCYYEPIQEFKRVRVVLLAPRQNPVNCP